MTLVQVIKTVAKDAAREQKFKEKNRKTYGNIKGIVYDGYWIFIYKYNENGKEKWDRRIARQEHVKAWLEGQYPHASTIYIEKEDKETYTQKFWENVIREQMGLKPVK